MKKRKLSVHFKFDDDNIRLPVSDTKKSIPKGYWVDQTGEGNHEVIDQPESKESEVEWWRLQDEFDEMAKKTGHKKGGEKSATTRKEQAAILHEDWLEIAKEIRKRSSSLSVPQIADKIIYRINEASGDYDFDPNRSKYVIEQYLREKLKKS